MRTSTWHLLMHKSSIGTNIVSSASWSKSTACGTKQHTKSKYHPHSQVQPIRLVLARASNKKITCIKLTHSRYPLLHCNYTNASLLRHYSVTAVDILQKVPLGWEYCPPLGINGICTISKIVRTLFVVVCAICRAANWLYSTLLLTFLAKPCWWLAWPHLQINKSIVIKWEGIFPILPAFLIFLCHP